MFDPQTIRNVFERLGQGNNDISYIEIYRAKKNKTLNFSSDSVQLDKKQTNNNCPC